MAELSNLLTPIVSEVGIGGLGGFLSGWARARAQCSFNLIRPWLFLGAVGSSLLMGRIFCGLICPMGILSSALFRPTREEIPVAGETQYLRYTRFFALLLFLYLTLDAAMIMLGLKPMQGLWSYLTKHQKGIAVIIVVSVLILLASSLFIYRPYCRFVCPIGTLLSLTNRFSLFTFGRRTDKCEGCENCVENCPLSIKALSESLDCFRCLSCYAACEKDALRLHPSVLKKQVKSQHMESIDHLLRSSHPGFSP